VTAELYGVPLLGTLEKMISTALCNQPLSGHVIAQLIGRESGNAFRAETRLAYWTLRRLLPEGVLLHSAILLLLFQFQTPYDPI
jgi:hypothetical protein